MLELLVVFGVLSLIGGGVYAYELWMSPLTARVAWMGLIGGAVSGVLWFALAAVLGNQRQILKDLELMKRQSAFGVQPTPGPRLSPVVDD